LKFTAHVLLLTVTSLIVGYMAGCTSLPSVLNVVGWASERASGL